MSRRSEENKGDFLFLVDRRVTIPLAMVMKFNALRILPLLVASLQAASAATTADFDATTNATWVRVLTLARIADGESSRGQQTMMMNITALPEGGAKRRTLKSLENPNYYYIQPSPWTTLVLGQNTVSIPVALVLTVPSRSNSIAMILSLMH